MISGKRQQREKVLLQVKLTGTTKEIIRSPEKTGNVREIWIILTPLPEMWNFPSLLASVFMVVPVVCMVKKA